MTSVSSRRRAAPISLAVTTADQDDSPTEHHPDRVLPPLPAGILGGLVAAAGGWLLVAGLVVAGWLSAQVGTFSAALGVATHVWLAGLGGGLHLGDVRWTVIPLGLTALFAVMVHAVAGFAARQGLAGVSDATEPERARAARRATGYVLIGYLIGPVAIAIWFGEAEQIARVLLGTVLMCAVFGWLGAARGARYRWLSQLPRPWPTVIRGTLASIGAVTLVSLIVLVVALVTHWQRVSELAAALEPGTSGAVVLWAAQAAFLPNAVIWAMAWVLGAGFTFGDGSIVSPAVTDLGLLPGIPVLGVFPAEGAGAIHPLWWLLGGVLGGVVAALWAARLRPTARFDETALVGGLAGLLGAVGIIALAAISGGDLGTEHLRGVGPRMPELVMMAVGVLGISGVVTGLVVGLLRWRRHTRAAAANSGLAADPGTATPADESESGSEDTADIDVRPGS